MNFLRRNWGWSIPIMIVIGLITLYHSYALKSERILSKFASGKDHFGFLLDGQVVGNPGDTIFFDLIPAVSFGIGNSYDKENQDLITVVSGDKKYQFYRMMGNIWNVPNPTGDGKYMRKWQGVTPEGFEAFQEVVENYSKVEYPWAKDLKRKFIRFGYSEKKATKLANKASKPIFSFRGSPSSGKSNTKG